MGLFSQKKPNAVLVADKQLSCLACQNDRFWSRTAQLNTAIASFFHLDWLNESATCAVCTECGFVHWFLQRPT